MQATLIYNGNSGGAEETSADMLQAALKEAGFSPVYKRTESESDLEEALEGVNGLVLVAGGDGTVHTVAKRLISADDVSLAIVPLGTANNIAKSLGIEGSPQNVIKALKSAEKRPLDVGHVHAPWGEDYFLEAAGCGLFADILADYDPEQGKSPLRAAHTLKAVLVDYDPKHWEISLDGKDLSDTYIAIEILNMKATGPRLNFAPDADPSDGLFDVACVLEPDATNFLDYLEHLFTDTFPALKNVEVLRGKKIEMKWSGSPIHIDDNLRPEQVTDLDDVEDERVDEHGTITFKNLHGAIDLWLPSGY